MHEKNAKTQPLTADRNLEDRLWRVRRRHDRIDARLQPVRAGWELAFLRNDRLLLTRQHHTREAALAEADAKLRELQRAGWNTHW
jgi:hypothetical protein